MAKTRLTVWDPMREFVTLRDAMDSLLEGSYVRSPSGSSEAPQAAAYCRPRADAWETEDAIVVEIAVPGVSPEQVDVMLEKDVLAISGEYSAPAEERDWLLRERPCGQFMRRFAINVPVDVDNVDATYHDGLLRLSLPKSEAVKPRRIDVKAD